MPNVPEEWNPILRMESNMRTINHTYPKISKKTSLWTDCTIRYSDTPRLMSPLSYDIIRKQKCKTIHISRPIVSLHIIWD